MSSFLKFIMFLYWKYKIYYDLQKIMKREILMYADYVDIRNFSFIEYVTILHDTKIYFLC